MYSRREKIEHFDRLKGGDFAEVDAELLMKKQPTHSKLIRFLQVPQRYAADILYALLDVCSVEEIEKNRKTASASSNTSTETASSKASTKGNGSSKASTKGNGSSKASTKKTSSKASTKKGGSSKTPTKKEEPSTADGSSKALTGESDKTEKEDAPDAPAVTDPPATEEAKKK